MKSDIYRVAVLACAAWTITGCGQRAGKREDAIRQGVIDYLSTRSGLDVSAMQVEVTALSLRKDEADATVSIRARGSTDPAGAMTLKYSLYWTGDHWAVKGKADGANPHGAGVGGLPPGHPSTAPSNPHGAPK